MDNASKRNAIKSKQLNLRSRLWPDLKSEELWNRMQKKGFTTIPRTMPIIMRIMDSMAPSGKPISAVYFELWCRAFDEYVVKLSNKEEMAFNSGFSGQRSVQTWNTRIDLLRDYGFIKLASGGQGERSFALIVNPYAVIKRHYEVKTKGVSQSLYNCLSARAIEIGADDI